MATIDIEYLPDEVVRRLQDRADAANQLLSDYVATELTRLVRDNDARPHGTDLVSAD